MTPARHRLDRYDEHGQDTWVSPDEERFAAEMGQPSVVPFPHHYPAVLCQTPVTCQKCGRQAIPFEDVIVCVDGGWLHNECAESHVLDGSTDH